MGHYIPCLSLLVGIREVSKFLLMTFAMDLKKIKKKRKLSFILFASELFLPAREGVSSLFNDALWHKDCYDRKIYIGLRLFYFLECYRVEGLS